MRGLGLLCLDVIRRGGIGLLALVHRPICRGWARFVMGQDRFGVLRGFEDSGELQAHPHSFGKERRVWQVVEPTSLKGGEGQIVGGGSTCRRCEPHVVVDRDRRCRWVVTCSRGFVRYAGSWEQGWSVDGMSGGTAEMNHDKRHSSCFVTH